MTNTYSLMPIKGLPNSVRKEWQNENLPEVFSGNTEELLDIIKNTFPNPLSEDMIRLRRRDLNCIMNLVIAPEASKFFGDFYRQDDATQDNPFVRDIPWIIKKITREEKKDCFANCNKEVTEKLRPKLLHFLNGIKNDELLYLCMANLEEFTKDWKGEIDLTKEIPLLISKIGAEGILGFSLVTDNIAKAMGRLAQARPKQTSTVFKVWNLFSDVCTGFKLLWQGKSQVKNLLKQDSEGPFRTQFAKDGWYYKQVEEYVKEEVERQLDTNSQHPFLLEMIKHVREEYSLGEDTKLNERAINTIVQNYMFLIFAFQETTSSLLRHMLWDLGNDQALQEYYRNICLEKKYDDDFANLGENFSVESGKIADLHMQHLAKLKPLIEYGLYKYSSAGWNRLMGLDCLFKKIADDNSLERKKLERSWRILKGEKVYYIPFISASLYREGNASFDKIDLKKKNFFHFGNGKHKCLGEGYARKEIKLLLDYILKRFELRSVTKNITFNFNHVLGSNEPIVVNMTRRK